MSKTGFKNELELQDLIAADPTIIPASACRSPEPRRWLLVQREARIPNPADTTSLWAVDFLLLDQDAMPTLVEVKLATPGKTARRQCLGQMLDYLTGARAAWDAHTLAAAYAATSPDDQHTLAQHTSMAPREFWRRAEENLQASRARLIYAAAQVSTEILSAIALLNSQLRTIEAYAVHISRARSGRALGAIARPVKTLPTAAPKKPPQAKAKAKPDRYQVLDKALLEEHLARPSWTDSDPLMCELARYAFDLGYTIKRELKRGRPESSLEIHLRPGLPGLFSIFPGFNGGLGGGSFDFTIYTLRRLGLSHLPADPQIRTKAGPLTRGGSPACMCSRVFDTFNHVVAFSELLVLVADAAGLPQASDAGGSLEQPSVEVPHPPKAPALEPSVERA